MRRPFFVALLLMVAVLTACSADMTGIDFATLVRPTTPNTYLVCPPDRCAVNPDAESPAIALSPNQLYDLIRFKLSEQPRTTLVSAEPERRRLVLVQRSRIFRFPDTITIQVFDLPDGGSTLAIYSASKYGRSDLGVNKARVTEWLALIQKAAEAI
jgi:uncharacterized protein (DUF1499 family)